MEAPRGFVGLQGVNLVSLFGLGHSQLLLPLDRRVLLSPWGNIFLGAFAKKNFDDGFAFGIGAVAPGARQALITRDAKDTTSIKLLSQRDDAIVKEPDIWRVQRV